MANPPQANMVAGVDKGPGGLSFVLDDKNETFWVSAVSNALSEMNALTIALGTEQRPAGPGAAYALNATTAVIATWNRQQALEESWLSRTRRAIAFIINELHRDAEKHFHKITMIRGFGQSLVRVWLYVRTGFIDSDPREAAQKIRVKLSQIQQGDGEDVTKFASRFEILAMKFEALMGAEMPLRERLDYFLRGIHGALLICVNDLRRERLVLQAQNPPVDLLWVDTVHRLKEFQGYVKNFLKTDKSDRSVLKSSLTAEEWKDYSD